MEKLKYAFSKMKGILFQINSLLSRYIHMTGEKLLKLLFRVTFLKLSHVQNLAIFQCSV